MLNKARAKFESAKIHIVFDYYLKGMLIIIGCKAITIFTYRTNVYMNTHENE